MNAAVARNLSIACFGLAAVIALIWIAGGPGSPNPAALPSQTYQPTTARNGLQIAVGTEWGAPIMAPGAVCIYWDSPMSGVTWETSTDGRTWRAGPADFFAYVRFRAPAPTTITFTVQDPPPPGQLCKRVY